MDEIREFFAQKKWKTELYQPWQLGIFHPHMDGKFVWYPENGTLMREENRSFGITNMGYHETKESVYETIQQTFNDTLPEGW